MDKVRILFCFYGGKSKGPEYMYSLMDVAGLPNLTVQLILLLSYLSPALSILYF